LYFAERSKTKVEQELEDFKEQLNEKRIEKREFDNTLTEKQRAGKDAFRAKQKLESQIHNEVF
jgi:hypothetical protein